MPTRSRTPRVSAPYSALLREALGKDGRLHIAALDSEDAGAFGQRLLRANVLTNLGLLARSTPSADGGHLFLLTEVGEALARTLDTKAPISGA